MEKCLAVADFFIANADPDEGITNLKLQKLCAYAQAFSLALYGENLFPDSLEAWPHGPVVPKVYSQYRAYGKNPLSTDARPEEARAPFSAKELYILETVNSYYGRFAAWTLRNMSHIDFPGNFNDPGKPSIGTAAICEKFADNKVILAIQEGI